MGIRREETRSHVKCLIRVTEKRRRMVFRT